MSHEQRTEAAVWGRRLTGAARSRASSRGSASLRIAPDPGKSGVEAHLDAVQRWGFERLVADYVQTSPSRSYTLNRLGDHLPKFLEQDADRENGAFLADLARYELAVTEAFDEEQSEVLSPEAVREIPPEAWPAIRMRPVAAFKLLALRYPVAAHVEAARKGWTPPDPRRRQTWVAKGMFSRVVTDQASA